MQRKYHCFRTSAFLAQGVNGHLFVKPLDVSSCFQVAWTDHHNNTDCCKWKGIQCNNVAALVEVLDLHHGPDTPYLIGPINITSLIALQNIQHLDLSNNYFWWSHIPQLMGSFTNLRYLNLSTTRFGGSIPSQLGNLLQLRYLDLGGNYL
ncbi:Leucine-rich repeat receptor-like tyrosine-protein kinase PXC3, partial [Mucuna pruriens]